MSSAWPPPPPDPATAPGLPLGPPSLRCYRHAKVDAPVTCIRCDRPICADCMVSAPVGWQCPGCVKGGPPVRSMRDVQAGGMLLGERPVVTYVLMALSVVGYLLSSTSPALFRYALTGFGIADGRLEQLVTVGFLHGGLIHLVFNMLVLFQLGSALEPRLGVARYLALYAASLLGGSIGILLLTDPRIASVGASGAVFGLMAATFVLPRRSRFGIEGSVGGLLVVNLLITFMPGLNISIGGHLGGLVAGGLVGLAYRALGERADLGRVVAGTAFALVLTGACVLAATPLAHWAIERRL